MNKTFNIRFEDVAIEVEAVFNDRGEYDYWKIADPVVQTLVSRLDMVLRRPGRDGLERNFDARMVSSRVNLDTGKAELIVELSDQAMPVYALINSAVEKCLERNVFFINLTDDDVVKNAFNYIQYGG